MSLITLADDFYEKLKRAAGDIDHDIVTSAVELLKRFVPENQLGHHVKLLDKLVKEATKWIGITESSPGADVFRKAVDGVAQGEPWCCAFVQYCAHAVALRYGASSMLYPTELCYTMWEKTPKECRLEQPIPGSVVVWNYPGTIRGHTGIVVGLAKDGYIHTIEGNTSSPKMVADHGVNRKVRSIKGSNEMKVLGFLVPFV